MGEPSPHIWVVFVIPGFVNTYDVFLCMYVDVPLIIMLYLMLHHKWGPGHSTRWEAILCIVSWIRVSWRRVPLIFNFGYYGHFGACIANENSVLLGFSFQIYIFYIYIPGSN